MPVPTANFAFNLPTVGGDADDWGGFLNGNWTSADLLFTSLFSNNRAATRPATVRNGGLWTDSDDNTIKFYNGTTDIPLVRVTGSGQEVLLALDSSDYVGRAGSTLALFMNNTSVIRFDDAHTTLVDDYELRFGTSGGTVLTHDSVDGFVLVSNVDVSVETTQDINLSAPTIKVDGNLEVTGDLVIGGAGGVPSGAVMAFAMATAPTGWLKANGAAVSRTTYAALFAAVGTTYGAGNGSTTFNLPDMRGEFVRGWVDDRTLEPETGRLIGSSELDAFQDHTHALRMGRSGGAPDTSRANYGATSSNFFLSDDAITTTIDNGGGTPRTAVETRPRNMALLYCIKT